MKLETQTLNVSRNEVCNGPDPCESHSGTAAPGTIAFASGARSSQQGDFLVAQITFCALREGPTSRSWEFDSRSRNSSVMSPKGIVISDPNLYKSYTINAGDILITPVATVLATAVATVVETAVAPSARSRNK